MNRLLLLLLCSLVQKTLNSFTPSRSHCPNIRPKLLSITHPIDRHLLLLIPHVLIMEGLLLIIPIHTTSVTIVLLFKDSISRTELRESIPLPHTMSRTLSIGHRHNASSLIGRLPLLLLLLRGGMNTKVGHRFESSLTTTTT
jgi:hypothetical protein